MPAKSLGIKTAHFVHHLSKRREWSPCLQPLPDMLVPQALAADEGYQVAARAYDAAGMRCRAAACEYRAASLRGGRRGSLDQERALIRMESMGIENPIAWTSMLIPRGR